MATVPDDVKTSIGAQTTVSVPAKFHGIQSTTMTAFVHSLGLLDWVTLEINSGWGDTSNECFLDNLADGTTTQQVSSGGYDTSTHAVDFVFHNPGHDSVNFTSPIVFAEYQEKTFLAQSGEAERGAKRRLGGVLGGGLERSDRYCFVLTYIYNFLSLRSHPLAHRRVDQVHFSAFQSGGERK